KPQQNTMNTVKTHSFFSGDPNVDSRSACSAYPFEKILDPIQPSAVSLQTSFPPAETIAETGLRFAETSQQTLRHFSLLPTTYNNFADKNAETLKLLRLLRLDPKSEWNFVAKVAAAAFPARCVHQLWSRCWSPVAKSLPFPSVSS